MSVILQEFSQYFSPLASQDTQQTVCTIIPINSVQDIPQAHKPNADFAGFNASEGAVLLCHCPNTPVAYVTAGQYKDPEYWSAMVEKLPAGLYTVASEFLNDNAIFGWAISHYSFQKYKAQKQDVPKRILITDTKTEKGVITAQSVAIARSLINTPANDMTPQILSEKVTEIGNIYTAKTTVISGQELETEFPLIHSVGKGSVNRPCLIDMQWGDPKNPLITLVGKGITFDSGGLDLKPSAGMLLMKKDMGGSANVLGLANFLMAMNTPIHLRVLIPSAENMVSSTSYRPSDILQSRNGMTIEVGNTDAEGRLVLADALTYAGEFEKPSALTIDMATLTGAARVAVGTEIAAFCSNDDTVAQNVQNAADCQYDDMWRLPLHQNYKKLLKSSIADTNSCSQGGYAGAITAGLFLEKFAPTDAPWVHVDLMGYNVTPRPGKPVGGEAMGIRALFDVIEQYGK